MLNLGFSNDNHYYWASRVWILPSSRNSRCLYNNKAQSVKFTMMGLYPCSYVLLDNIILPYLGILQGQTGVECCKAQDIAFPLTVSNHRGNVQHTKSQWILKKFKCSRSSEKRIHCEVWWLKRASEESRFKLCLGKQARLWSEQLGEANHIVSKGEEAGKQKMP